jgi:hypothetical protein
MSKVGSIKLVDVKEKFSRAAAITGTGMKKGYIVLPAPSGGSDWK